MGEELGVFDFISVFKRENNTEDGESSNGVNSLDLFYLFPNNAFVVWSNSVLLVNNIFDKYW